MIINPDPDINLDTISDVGFTSLLTLYCRALESRSKAPILIDDNAAAMMDILNHYLSTSNDRLARKMASEKLDKRLWVHIALRSQKYDQTIREFLSRFPDASMVNIGCGLDPRFPRVDNGQVQFYDLDLPEIITLKKAFIKPIERYQMLATSVLDHQWMDTVLAASPGAVLFVAEGVFMYLNPAKVKDLILTLRARFNNAELIFETINKVWVSPTIKKIASFKMQKQVGLGKGSEFHFGINPKDELESWHPTIQFLEDWSYFDTGHKKLGWMRCFKNIPFMRNTQYTVRYRLS